jgi:hypothetical protein
MRVEKGVMRERARFIQQQPTKTLHAQTKEGSNDRVVTVK